MNRPAAVVTGVSTGIGRATAQVLVRAGWRVFGSVRRLKDAMTLVESLGDEFVPLVFDLTDQDAIRAEAARVEGLLSGRTLAGLVNNAGIAVPGPLLHLPLADFRRQIEVNLTGQLAVTQAFAPLLGADRSRTGPPGRIVMMSSVGGRVAGPFLGAYVAAKHGLEGMSATLRRELMLYRIDVVIVGPGRIATPIWDKAEAVDIAPFAATDYAPALKDMRDFMLAEGRRGLPAERVATVVLKALTVRHPRARYAVVPRSFRDWMLPRLLPARMFDRMIAKKLGFPGR